SELGLKYCRGIHVTKKWATGMELLFRATEKGYPNAFYNLGLVLTDEGFAQNLVSSYGWLTIAIYLGVDDAKSIRENVKASLSDNDLIQAYQKMEMWLSDNVSVRLEIDSMAKLNDEILNNPRFRAKVPK
ncbi:MAG: hypothetical protein KJT03_07055, partial [Verrucomicrobiae bacterium]|nr:hypothetical protein [Verrucomicrobiae bacterium]